MYHQKCAGAFNEGREAILDYCTHLVAIGKPWRHAVIVRGELNHFALFAVQRGKTVFEIEKQDIDEHLLLFRNRKDGKRVATRKRSMFHAFYEWLLLHQKVARHPLA